MIERGGLRVYHSGDTAWFDGFALIGDNCGAIDAAMLPIGAYAPRWFMRPQHMDPEDAVRAFAALGAGAFRRHALGHLQADRRGPARAATAAGAAWQRENLPQQRLAVPAIGETLPL